MRSRSLLFILPILVWLLAACSTDSSPASTTEPAAADIPREANYFNDEAGFYLALPDEWQEFGPVLNQIDPSKPFVVFYLFPGPVAPDGGINVSHIILADKTEWTAEELVKTQCRSCPNHPFEAVTLGGKPAQKTQIGGGEIPVLINWYFFEHQDFLVGITFVDPDTLESLDGIVESIYFP